MKKRTTLWIGLFAFVFGQLIQIITNAMAHYLYMSDPVLMCVTVGIVTVALVVMTAVFTLMEPDAKTEKTFSRHTKPEDFSDIIPPIFRNWKERPPLDTDPIDITEEDENVMDETGHEPVFRDVV